MNCNECGEPAKYYCAGDSLVDGEDIPEPESFWCEAHQKIGSKLIVHTEPPIGSWASVARAMAKDDDSGFDWDAWKDEMKESEFE